MRKHWLITGVLFIFLALQSYSLIWSWVLTPSINPHPKDAVTIRGAFPFDKGYDLQVYHVAYTSTPWVNSWCGWPVPGRPISCRGGRQTLAVKKTDATHYEIVFYRDYYLPGIAGWEFGGLIYRAPSTRTQGEGRIGGSFPWQNTAVKCFESDAPDRHLICLALDKTGPDIYKQPTRHAEVNFYLKSEFPAHPVNSTNAPQKGR
jgi:hypothetical protein